MKKLLPFLVLFLACGGKILLPEEDSVPEQEQDFEVDSGRSKKPEAGSYDASSEKQNRDANCVSRSGWYNECFVYYEKCDDRDLVGINIECPFDGPAATPGDPNPGPM